jgi:hypothetical protein
MPPGWSKATPGGDQRSGRSQDSSISTLSAAEISFSMSTEPVLAPVSICDVIRLFQQSLVLGDRDYDESQAPCSRPDIDDNQPVNPNDFSETRKLWALSPLISNGWKTDLPLYFLILFSTFWLLGKYPIDHSSKSRSTISL